MRKTGEFYLVATPIGNLGDITYRAVEILKNVDIIIAEDTRHSLKLLNYLGISKPLISYHRHSDDNKINLIIQKIKDGENIAVISDAGTPAISDPGEDLVKEAIKNNIKVIPVPGACALINALIASGLDTKEFSFYGFLPLNKKLRKNKFEEIKHDNKTTILYEAPHKIKNTLNDIFEELGNVNIVIARELTKIHEEFIRGQVLEIINQSDNLKGEIIIIIEGNKQLELKEENMLLNLDVEQHYDFYRAQGLDKKEIIKKIAKERNVNKNEIYMKLIEK